MIHLFGTVSNIGLTFGGHWDEDDRSNVSNWVDNDSTVPFSQEPRRVPKVRYWLGFIGLALSL